jgi:hypothetical protein
VAGCTAMLGEPGWAASISSWCLGSAVARVFRRYLRGGLTLTLRQVRHPAVGGHRTAKRVISRPRLPADRSVSSGGTGPEEQGIPCQCTAP